MRSNLTNLRNMRNKGFVTVTLTVLLLAIIILVTLYTAKFKAQEQRIMRNHMALMEARMVGDAALEQVIQEIDKDRTNLDRTFSGEIGGAPYQATIASVNYPTTSRGKVNVVEVEIVANSADGSATKRVFQDLVVMSLVRSEPTVPLAIRGASTASGSFEVVANPNGGGDGVPLSIWSGEDIDGSGSFSTCNQQEYEFGVCGTDTLSENGDFDIDIFDEDPNFPDDLLDFLFGIPESQWETLRNSAEQQLTSCAGLDQNTTGFIWVTGACSIGANTTIGSPDAPVILIVHNGDLTMGGGAEVNGMVFQFSPTDDPTHGTYDIKLNGTVVVHGALVMNQAVELSNGNFTIHYDGNLLSQMTTESEFLRVYRVGGSWHDFM
ncbi:hypothetical protein ACFOD1_03245 [Pseudidiomarina halophila]|uniref:Type 4 fimbrial biogenesis protein PilX N-terminal domain-containing protein n=1 Tax=Pseudidiomarina halophila TaxID=1449799 RepID=A0A432XZ22_9GAMM|nr:hypothetical protein [Pseudidiomarina halophila]RUO53969.1 hypothetical protein CWI69_00585 [Pseudidiomarina halophila]